ncbi:VOC family protein [Ruminococcus albus]|uniref:Lactoylglutathione lyase n=1 Tax=Ruminococcus albus TaxID=1264 RepID=A0A1I1IKJ0_RUMAL|nr:VOC family protein [Ruminococcus albus]SFC36747.1 lactoylglutathione lyase [Ruminococcus albus]
MKIEHTALYVNDLEGAKDFFTKYLNAKSGDIYRNPSTGFSSYFLSFDEGSRLEIMNKPNLFEDDNRVSRMGYAHIAFSAGSREKVDELTKCITDDGFRLQSPPRVTGDGYYESCIIGFEGNLIEITE